MITEGPVGDLWITRTPAGPLIGCSDPLILIADEFLTEMRAGEMPAVAVVGDVVTFEGVNRTVAYRLTGARDPWGSYYAELVP